MIASTKHSISAVAAVYVCSWQWRSLAPEICQIFPFPMTFSAISPQMRDFLLSQKRSLPTWEVKTKPRTSKSTKTWLNVFNEWKVQHNEAKKLEDISCHELDAIICRFFTEIRKRTIKITNQKVWLSYSTLRDCEFANSRHQHEVKQENYKCRVTESKKCFLCF